MVATFFWLKVRLYRNAFRSAGAAKLAVLGGLIFAAWGIGSVYAGASVIRSSKPELAEPWTIIFLCSAVLLWAIVPLSMGYTDSTVDPTKLLLIPLRRHHLMSGLLVSAATGIVPVLTLVAFLASLVLVGSVAQAIYAAVAAVVATALCIAAAQAGAAVISGLVRRQGTRSAATVLVAVLGGGLGIGMQFAPQLLRFSADQVWSVARWLRWLPGGWIGQGMVWSRRGEWVPGILVLILSALFVVLLVVVWGQILDRMLVSPTEQVAVRIDEDGFVPRALQWLPDLVATTTSRSLKLLRRDNREWAAFIGSLPLLVLAALPVVGAPRAEATLLIGSVGLYGGLLNGGMLGFDGPSIWLDQLAHPTLKPLLVGKSVSRGLIMLPVAVVAGLGLALFVGGWRFLPAGWAAAFCGFGIMSGAGAVGSVRFAAPVPESPNVFGGGSAQSGAIFSQMLLLAGSILAAAPALGALVGASLWRWWAGWLVIPFALAYGAFGWRWGLRMAADEADNRAPELFARLQL